MQFRIYTIIAPKSLLNIEKIKEDRKMRKTKRNSQRISSISVFIYFIHEGN
jgi:hypothetical protein